MTRASAARRYETVDDACGELGQIREAAQKKREKRLAELNPEQRQRVGQLELLINSAPPARLAPAPAGGHFAGVARVANEREYSSHLCLGIAFAVLLFVGAYLAQRKRSDSEVLLGRVLMGVGGGLFAVGVGVACCARYDQRRRYEHYRQGHNGAVIEYRTIMGYPRTAEALALALIPRQ
jgi:hypothetical protein